MDWSLVLLSQEIESVIEHSEEGGWGLIVAHQDYERALATIRQYRFENLRWPWRQKIHQTLLFDWGSVAWACLIILFYQLDAKGMNLRSAGLMDSSAVARGEWWRLFTAMFLHADLGHLASNTGFGLVLLGLTMGICGTGVGLLSAYLAGFGGNVASWLIDANHHSLGASGMVMGCLGLLAVQSVPNWRSNPKILKSLVGGIVAGVMLFLLLGSSPGTDLIAHAGGFVTGALLGGILALAPRLGQNTAVNLIAGALFCLLVILPWWLALEHTG